MIDMLDSPIELEFTTAENGPEGTIVFKEFFITLPNRASLQALIDAAEDALEGLDSPENM
jgi:hypothetical protein